MDTSPSLVRSASADDAPATTAFLAAFDAASRDPHYAELQALFISAVVECAGPPQVRAFIRRLHTTLDETGRLDDVQRAQWHWLLVEFGLMEELDTKRFDGSVAVALTQLEARIERGNDSASVVMEDPPDAPDGPAQDIPLSWETIATAIRESSRQTLRRLVSGGSARESRESIGSIEFPTESSTRSSRQRYSQASDRTYAIGPLVVQRQSSAVSDTSTSHRLWSLSSRLGMAMDETCLCQICFEHVAMIDAAQLAACSHRFCVPCLKTYLELKIVEGQVYPVCFHETDPTETPPSPSSSPSQPQVPIRKACGASILPSDIEALVSTDVWKKYLLFKFNKENQHGRQCPHCDVSQLCAGPEHPQCLCVACAKPFCFSHGSAHADGTCADFELKQAETDKLNRSAIAEISKPCPGCKSNVEKSGGCNHMKCIVCDTDFCWICGAVVDSNAAPLHFQWWNVRGCAGQQMEDVDAQSPSERFWMNVLRMVMVVFLGPPALAITLVITLVSCGCVPCMAALQLTFRDCFTTCLNFVVLGLLFAITGVGLAVMFVCTLLWGIVTYPITRLRSRRSAPHRPPSPPPTIAQSQSSDQVSLA